MKLQVNCRFAADEDANLRVQDAGGVGGTLPAAEGVCMGEEEGVEGRQNGV